jgi:uncharacterized protein YdaU (DUF1376 family)
MPKKIDIWMPLFIGDYLKDTGFLSLEEHGAYFILLMELWIHGGYLDKKKVLKKIPVKIWENICEFFQEEDGMIYQKRLLAELEAAKARGESARKKARKRWDNE